MITDEDKERVRQATDVLALVGETGITVSAVTGRVAVLSGAMANVHKALAAIKAADGGAGDLEDIIPLYLRKSQAERLYKPKQEDQK